MGWLNPSRTAAAPVEARTGLGAVACNLEGCFPTQGEE